MAQPNTPPEWYRIYVIAALGAVLLSVLPVILFGFLPGHDYSVHNVWLTEFHKQLAAGEGYPRWLLDANDGLGTPAFFFHGPLSYVVSTLLVFLTGGAVSIPHILGFSCAIAGLLSFVFADLWLRGWVPRPAALAGATFYAVAPYHVTIDLYNRAAFPEYWAFVWLPLILWAADRVFKSLPAAVPVLAGAYSLLVFTHLPTTTLFSPLLFAYIIWRGRANRRTWVSGLAALGLGAALCAVFIIPGYVEQRHIQVDMLRTGFYDYRNWFLFKSWLHPINEMLDRWNWITLSTVVAAMAWFRVHRKYSRAGAGICMFFAYSTPALLFMMSPLSARIWALFLPLQTVQFPVRFNTNFILAGSALVGYGVAAARRRQDATVRFALASSAVCLILFSYLGSAFWLVQKRDTIWGASTFRREIDLRLEHKIDGYFVPVQAPAFHNAIDTDSVAQVVQTVLHGQQVDIRRETAGPYRLRFLVHGGAGRQIKLPVFYYPNWVAVNPAGRRYDIGASRPDGLISVPLAGDDEVILLTFTKSAEERLGELISFGALVVVAAVTAVPLMRRRTPGPNHRYKAAASA